MGLLRISKGYVGFGLQTEFGTPVPVDQFTRFRSPSLEPQQKVDYYYEGGGGRYQTLSLKSEHSHGGKMDMFLRPSVCAQLAAYALGNDEVSGLAAPYKHTITPAEDIPWITVERGIGRIYERIQDCKVDVMEIKGSSGKPIDFSVDVKGALATLLESPSEETYELDQPFTFFHSAFSVFGSPIKRVQDFSFKYSNKLEALHTDEIYPYDNLPGGVEATLEMSILYDTEDEFYETVFYDETGAPSETVYTGEFELAFAYGTESALRSFAIIIPALHCLVATLPGPEAEPKAVVQKISGNAILPPIEGEAEQEPIVTIEVENADDTAYVEYVEEGGGVP